VTTKQSQIATDLIVLWGAMWAAFFLGAVWLRSVVLIVALVIAHFAWRLFGA
jgi:hypothetical protein